MNSLHKDVVWQKVLDDSHDRPQLVFKHSSKCGASLEAHKKIKAIEQNEALESNMYIVIVQVAEDISNLIERDTGIKHETPQVLIVRDGEVVYHASHDDIDEQEVAKQLVMAK